MTELEKRLTDALAALSEQYEREQRRQAEQYEALQEQMQRLEEAVKDLKPQLGRTGSCYPLGACRTFGVSPVVSTMSLFGPKR